MDYSNRYISLSFGFTEVGLPLNLFVLCSFSSSLLTLLLANFVFYKNSKSAANRLFALFCLLMALWGFNEGMYRSADSYEEALFWTKMNLTVWWCCATFIHFTLVFTETAKRVTRWLMSVYYPCAVLGALYESIRAVPEKVSWGYTYAIDPNPWVSNAVFAYFTSINLIPAILIIRYFLKQPKGSRKRTQVRWMLLAITLPILVSLFELISIFLVHHRVPEFTIVSMSWLGAIIVYASWRYELFQISPEKAADRILEMMADALLITTLEGKVLFTNSSTQQLLGYSEEELLALSLTELFVNDQEVSQLLSEHNSKGSAQREALFQTQAGEELIVQYSASTYRMGGEPLGLIFTFHDISQRKRDENQIKDLNHKLSDKNIEMEQMIYMVTHDLRAPLMNIGGITELMTESLSELDSLVNQLERDALLEALQSLIQEELNEPITDLQVTTNKMTSLVNSLLEVTRLTNRTPSEQPINMNQLIDGIYQANAYRIKTSELEVSREDLPECVADSALMDQIFSNLIDNAIKYLDPQRKPSITVSASEEPKALIYAVKDTGLGIPQDQFDSIFRSFTQLDQRSEGYGIGLSTIVKLVHKQGGRIWLDSEVGVGTTFFVSVPKRQGGPRSV